MTLDTITSMPKLEYRILNTKDWKKRFSYQSSKSHILNSNDGFGFILMVIIVALSAMVLTAGGFFYLQRSKTAPSPPPKEDNLTEVPATVEKEDTDESPTEQLIKSVEQSTTGDNSEATDTLKKQISDLTKIVTDLNNRVTTLEKQDKTVVLNQNLPVTSNNQTSQTKAPVYIPLGSGGNISSTTYQNSTVQSVAIDTSKYSGYTSMVLQVSLQIYQNGTAYARLYNTTDGTAILGSEVSTNSKTYTQLTSGGFTLPSGQKNYVLQLRSDTGYASQTGNATIVVYFN